MSAPCNACDIELLRDPSPSPEDLVIAALEAEWWRRYLEVDTMTGEERADLAKRWRAE